MERDQFLKTFGLGLALVCSGTCFQGCKKGQEEEPVNNTGNNTGNTNQVSVDISTLATVGSQKVLNGVLFFRIASANEASSFVATEALCPHQGGNLSWLSGSSKIQCDNHQAQFSSSGSVLANPSSGGTVRPLKIYSTTLTGSTLTATKA